MNADESRGRSTFWTSRTGIALCGFIAIAAVLLILEHRAHTLQWLPFALLLACPLMHLFHGHGGHRGHGDHGGHSGHGSGQQDKMERASESDTDRRA